MNLSLLVETKMLPVPQGITIVCNYGLEAVISGDGMPMATGECMLITAEPAAIKAWLRPFDSVWLGNGQTGFEARELRTE